MVTKDPYAKIRITSLNQFIQEFEQLKTALLVEETEDTWEKIDSSLKRFIAVVRGGGCDYPEEFVKRWKDTEIVRGIVNAMSTDRTRLSGTALDLMGSTSRLGSHWESAIPFYVPTIVKLLGRASKIYVTRASITLNSLIRGTRSVAFIPYLADGVSEKSLTMRIGCAEALLCCLSSIMDPENKVSENLSKSRSHRDVLGKKMNDIEKVIKTGGRDRDPKVRAIFKQIWELYQQHWPTRAVTLSQPFTPTIKRYLGISASSSSDPQPAHSGPSGPHRAQVSQNSSKATGSESNRERPPTSSSSRNGVKNGSASRSNSANGATKTVIEAKRSAPVAPRPAATNSNDLATLRKAISVPLPPDDPPLSPTHNFHRAPHPARVNQAGSQSGAVMKRSNSTMRAQRVPLAPQADGQGVFHAVGMKAAGRAPFQPLSHSENQPVALGLSTKSSGNANFISNSSKSQQLKLASSDQTNALANRGYKPSRNPSDSTKTTAPKPSTHPQEPVLPTRPLPKRATPAVPVSEPPSEPPANLLNVSVRSNNHSKSRKAVPDETVPILKQTRKAFKPTKSGSKSASSATTSVTEAAPKPVTKVKSSSSTPATTSSALEPTQTVKELATKISVAAPSSSPPPPPASEPLQVSRPSTPKAPRDFTPPAVTEIPPDIKEEPPHDPKPESSQPPVLALPPPIQPIVTVPPVPQNKPQKVNNEMESKKTFNSTKKTKAAAVPMPPWPPSFANSTPGPKIMTRLPDDLIVPMSIPLPPSPNSPYLNMGVRSIKKSKSTSRSKKARSKTASSSRTQPKNSSAGFPVTGKAGQSAPNPRSAKAGTDLHRSTKSRELTEISDEALLEQSVSTIQVTDDDDEEGDVTQRPSGPEGILVDFNHEDTIWIPRTPTVHGDLAPLADTSLFKPSKSETSDDGEDGPDEKRPRLESEKLVLNESQIMNQDQGRHQSLNDLKNAQPLKSIENEALKRRDSVFHWDQAELELMKESAEEVSEDKTVSCLREQPEFLGGEITVNDGRSFFTNFLSGISAQNQSTPASGVGVEVFSRFRGDMNRSP